MAPVEEEDRSPLLKEEEAEEQQQVNSQEDNKVNNEGEEGTCPPETAVYHRRWYVLCVFCLLAITQGFMWNTWGPVSDSATLVFGWTNAEIGLFAILGNASYSLTVFGAAYIMDTLGLRKAALSMATMLAVGAAVRCITSHRIVLFWMSVLSALLSGVAGTVTFSGPALFSAVWFPPSQRATANAIINAFNFLGVSVSFLIGPAMVHYMNPANQTLVNPDTSAAVDPFTDRPLFPHWTGQEVHRVAYTSDNHTESVIKKQTEEIMLYLYVQAGIAGALLLLVIIYFPSKPPRPPSISAATTRLDFGKGLWELTKNRSFWLLALAYSIPSGLFGVWGSVLNANLGPMGVTQRQAGQIGLYYNLAGGVAGLGVSRFSDLLVGHMKQILVVLYVLAGGALWWIIMLAQQYIPFNLPSLYVSAILASIFINGGVALFYELSSEMCYPVAEGIIGGYLTLLNNIMGISFLCLLFIPHIGTMWMNWIMFAGTLIALPMLFLVKAKYRRLQLDTHYGEGTSVQA